MADTKVFSFPYNGNSGGGLNSNDFWPLLLMTGLSAVGSSVMIGPSRDVATSCS